MHKIVSSIYLVYSFALPMQEVLSPVCAFNTDDAHMYTTKTELISLSCLCTFNIKGISVAMAIVM